MATRNAYDFPSTPQIVDENGNLTVAWGQWIQRTQNIVRTLNTSGPTTQRPVDLLYIGIFFFDTTINKPIWLRSINPNVWVDGAGIVS